MSLSCIRAKVEVLRIVVCGSCLAVYTCKNSEGSASKLLLSQMQGACKNYRENLKMSRYEVKHTGGSGKVAHYQMMAKISLFSIYFLPFVPMDHFPAPVSSGHCPAWQWKSSELCTTQLPQPSNTIHSFAIIFSAKVRRISTSNFSSNRDVY